MDESTNEQSIQPKKKSPWIKVILVFIALTIIIGGFFTYKVYATSKKILEKPSQNSIVSQITDVISKPKEDERLLQGEAEDRINIVLLGLGGASDKGGGQWLTDTIILLSIQPKEKQAALISIPRDLYVKIPGYWSSKINGAYAYAYNKTNSEFEASKVAMDTISMVTGQDINYYVRLDFDGFKQVVDTLGGVDINVENSFTDRQYPTYNLGYQKVLFKAGQTHMDGETALKFARSRKADQAIEAGDFARARRQQKVLQSVKEKALSTQTLLDPTKISGILDALASHVGTNLELWELNKLSKMASDFNTDNIINFVVSSDNFLRFANDPTAGSIVVPREGANKYTNLQTYIANIFITGPTQLEKATIAVYNGTGKSGFGQKVADQLQQNGFTVLRTGTMPTSNYDATILYDNINGQKPNSFTTLAKEYNALISPELLVKQEPEQMSETITADNSTNKKIDQKKPADFILIIGKDYYEQFYSSEDKLGDK